MTRDINIECNDANIIRLVYFRIEDFVREDSFFKRKLGKTLGFSSAFKIPEGMTLNQACDVISYLFEKAAQDGEFEPESNACTAHVSNQLSAFGFQKLEEYKPGYCHSVHNYSRVALKNTDHYLPIPGVVDLMSIGGDIDLFEKTDLSERYVEWFTPGITKEQVNEIYASTGNESICNLMLR